MGEYISQSRKRRKLAPCYRQRRRTILPLSTSMIPDPGRTRPPDPCDCTELHRIPRKPRAGIQCNRQSALPSARKEPIFARPGVFSPPIVEKQHCIPTHRSTGCWRTETRQRSISCKVKIGRVYIETGSCSAASHEPIGAWRPTLCGDASRANPVKQGARQAEHAATAVHP